MPRKMGFGADKPWCQGCSSLQTCDFKKPTCLEPGDGKSCETCLNAEWQRTPTGKIKRNSTGRCSERKLFESKLPPMPFFLKYRVNEVITGHFNPATCRWRQGILPSDGKDCECHLKRLEG